MATHSLDALRELMRHMECADASVWRAVLAHPPGLQDERLRLLLLHLHGVQRAFLAMWSGRPPKLPSGDARLRDVGGEPPLVDYIAWIWFGRPAPAWSSVSPAIG